MTTKTTTDEMVIEVSVENMGPGATEADAEEYRAWADEWFSEEYPDLHVVHTRGGNRTPYEVYDEEQECWAAWCRS